MKTMGWMNMAVWLRAVLVALAVGLVALPATGRAGNVGLNLAAVHDWSPQAPFLDHMKSARPWIGHLPGRWGGLGETELRLMSLLDSDGWPRRLTGELGAIGTLVLVDLPEAATGLAGRYLLRFEGRGIVEVTGRVSNVRYGDGSVGFDFVPGPGEVEIRIQRSRASDPVRNITLVHEDHVAAFDAGARFNPDWLARISGFGVLRFMDWMQTNNSDIVSWQDRPRTGDYSWARTGVPLEVMIELANLTGIDPWFTLPHKADDAYVRQFAETVRDRLDPALRAHVEYSNEVWNWQFEQARWAEDMARTLWGADDAWVQYYGVRAAEVARIWTDVFGAEAPARLVNVVATQTGWRGLEEAILTAPLAMASANPPPATPASAFDAYAVTGYFGGIIGIDGGAARTRAWIAESRAAATAEADALGLTGAARDAHIARHQYDLASARAGAELMDGAISGDDTDTVAALLNDVLPYHQRAARDYGLNLIMYEGGTHVAGLGAQVDDVTLEGFFTHFNYTPEMGRLYDRLLQGWSDLTDGMFTAYSDVYAPGKWGSWGALRHLQDDNPRWDALIRHRDRAR